MAFGLVFYSWGYASNDGNAGQLWNSLSLIFTGIGGSILATGITAYMIDRFEVIDDIPLIPVIQSLGDSAIMHRENQSLELTLQLAEDKNYVIATKRHRYSINNTSNKEKSTELSIFTDSIASLPGNFKRIRLPNTNCDLEGHELANRCELEDGKRSFRHPVNLSPGLNTGMEFDIETHYRRLDRVIWTVQELSDNFKVRIFNKTGIKGKIGIKINHHHEHGIRKGIKTSNDGSEIDFEITSKLLPYQGFEIWWNFDEQS